tara:strand:+ start:157 stop:528 length:372 start_codon:yes stop_codon:yes gene_type:complete
MAHFAELDETNTVLRILVVHNDVTTIDGVEDEQRGIDFLNGMFPESGTWVQTSFNHNFRNRYAGTGYTYDPASDVFITPQSFPSWTLNEDTTDWEPPTPYPGVPGEEPHYVWDEDTTSWVEVE